MDITPNYEALASRGFLSLEEIALTICGINPDLNGAGSYGAFSAPPPFLPGHLNISSSLSKLISEDKKLLIQEVYGALYQLCEGTFINLEDIENRLQDFKYSLPIKLKDLLKKRYGDKDPALRKEKNKDKLISLMTISLAKKSGNLYLHGGRINASKMISDLTELARELGISDVGLKSMDRCISNGISEIENEYSISMKDIFFQKQ